ncbi:MAG: Sigma 54 modulation protein/ribosomal protein S30EA [Thermotoga sp. 50_1627]|uniref:ribosome hibernation-promoting factor, HPF/YfiA family n=1 Tax=Pseudothermotoga sp. TaxID=2033661 RepID=UPI00076BD7A4|nr:MAG: Sigma 54 modulation protein/ribosomal protein S30EA [Thermotoga sp. 50_64]KUK25329.1 MAG: Sigma 54 modulation protein/ribosomal protein S30EA [Thermotoga sp. 50_1627]MBC7117012.1 ribosome-associated translation inhibitor RaiA [Pseudothermotoga sp.]MDK2923994.1 putative sigma-54 modulation protein [Pseudothermotoga sp.]HBT39887.1 ribosome-associated translation inhibitor RaiA [Pseudothermotoga sp.]
MNYRFTTRGFEATAAMQQYLEKRLEKVDRVIRDEELVSAEIKAEKDAVNYVVKANINLRGNVIVVQEKDPDLYAAIDNLCDALEKKVKKLKSTIRDKHREPKQLEISSVAEESEEEVAETRRLPLNVMPMEEAILQFKAMDRQFFLFRNSETGEINLLLLRKDGKLSLYEFFE